MVKKKVEASPSAIVQLEAVTGQANSERVAKIRKWHIDQAISDSKPVAMINFTLTESGEIESRAILVEEAHAKVMLPVMIDAIYELGGMVEPRVAKEPDPISGPYLGDRSRTQKYWNQCEICSDTLHADHIFKFDTKTQGSPSPRIALLCAPCYLSASATAAIARPRLNIV